MMLEEKLLLKRGSFKEHQYTRPVPSLKEQHGILTTHLICNFVFHAYL